MGPWRKRLKRGVRKWKNSRSFKKSTLILREPFGSFILIVGLAKLGRYLVVAGAALRWLA